MLQIACVDSPMSLMEHAAKTAVGVVVVGIVLTIAAYYGLSTTQSAIWLHGIAKAMTAERTVPVWGYWTLWAVASVSVALHVIHFIVYNLSPEPTARQAYDSDIIESFKWRWYVGSDDHVMNPRMYCRKCESAQHSMSMNPGDDTTVQCLHCKLETPVSGLMKLADRVKAEAERRIRSGEWKGAAKRLRKGRN